MHSVRDLKWWKFSTPQFSMSHVDMINFEHRYEHEKWPGPCDRRRESNPFKPIVYHNSVVENITWFLQCLLHLVWKHTTFDNRYWAKLRKQCNCMYAVIPFNDLHKCTATENWIRKPTESHSLSILSRRLCIQCICLLLYRLGLLCPTTIQAVRSYQ